MTLVSDGGGFPLRSLSHQLTPGDVNMDLTMCGLLTKRAEELARLYAKYGNWNDVKDIWFDERRSNRSTRGSYLFQSENRWEELFDWVVSTDAWEYLDLHGNLDTRPTDEPYSWLHDGGEV